MPDWVSGFVAVTATVPAPDGERHVIEVAETTAIDVAAFVPNNTVAPVWKPVPVSVTVVPPAGVPPTGLTAETVGAAAYR